MKLLLSLLLIASVTAMYESGGDVINLDSSNFDAHVGGDKPAFVEFYAPWCGHCKSLAPEYEKLATAFKNQPVVIAAVDADKDRDLGTRFGVSGFPTLKYFPANAKDGEAYNGGRSAKEILDFINGKAGTSGRIKEAPTAVTVLTDDNFDSIVKDPKKHVFVEFYAPWCGHCKKLAPDWEKLAKIFSGDSDVVIAKMDATEHKVAPGKFGVSGYPTLKWFPKDNKDGLSYDGGRAMTDFITFLNEKSGSERTADGGFSPDAGRIPELDELAERFMKNPNDRKAILTQAETKIASSTHKNAEYAKFYKIAMKRIMDKGGDFATEESARLERMISSGSVAPEKLPEFHKRINIAKAFKA